MSTYLSQIENFDYPSALSSINSEIKRSGTNIHLIQAKIFCLINMSKFTLAISTIKMSRKIDESLRINFILEEAYCLYRLGKFGSSLNLIEREQVQSQREDDNRLKALKGQVFYRLERFNEAAEIFQELLVNDQHPSEELKVNLLAAQAQAGLNSESQETESFDLLYNSALVKFASKDFKSAENLANDCESFSNDENVSPSNLINSKLLAICVSMNDKGNLPESHFLLRKLQASSSITPLQNLLITSNLMAASEGGKTFADFDLASVDKLSLFGSQKRQILINAHHSGFVLTKNQLKMFKDDHLMDIDQNTSNFVTVKSLKESFKTAKVKKSAPSKTKTLDKERWLPLRDRSYYKPKAQYLKSTKNSKSIKK